MITPFSQECWNQLSKQFEEGEIEFVHDIWDQMAFERLVRRRSIFLNVHKACGKPHSPVEVFRTVWLVAARALVVSERAYPADEAYMNGSVSFVKFEHLRAEFSRLRSMSPDKRRELAQARWEAFSEGRDAPALLDRSGVSKLLRKLLRRSRA